MIKRMASTAAITVRNLNSSAKTNVNAPRNNSETCGKRFFGCTRANTLKKLPSKAAEYGTREYPSSEENTDANAIHKIITVAKRAAPLPYNFSMNALTMNGESWA